MTHLTTQQLMEASVNSMLAMSVSEFLHAQVETCSLEACGHDIETPESLADAAEANAQLAVAQQAMNTVLDKIARRVFLMYPDGLDMEEVTPEAEPAPRGTSDSR